MTGTAYLRVTGEFEDTTFTRGDPVPYMFQPVSLESLGDGSNDGGVTTLGPGESTEIPSSRPRPTRSD